MTLRRLIARTGLQRPLIVRPDGDSERYQVTGGWQRYQAATDLGWEQSPVRLYEGTIPVLKATEGASIVREWSTLQWIKYCQSVVRKLRATDSAADRLETHGQVASAVADRTVRCGQTVRRYLAALSLPDVVHPLFGDGPDGTD